MTEKENRVRLYEHDVREQETRVREARVAMEQGYKKLQADMENEYSKLKSEYERQQIKLEREKQSLAFAKDEAAKGFES